MGTRLLVVGVTLAVAACGVESTPAANTDEAPMDFTSAEPPSPTTVSPATGASSPDALPHSDPSHGDSPHSETSAPVPPAGTAWNEAAEETVATGVNSDVDTSDVNSADVADTLDGKQNQHAQGGMCDDEGCECDAGFGYFPEVEAARCLQLCDVMDVLPIDSDADVATLAAQGCEAVEGGLTASGSGVTTLEGLETIRYVGGDLVIQDTVAPTLAGLSGLARYSGTLVLINNTELTGLGWYQLKRAGEGGLVVLSNPKLTTLSGFDGASFPKISVTIVGNDALVNLDGLENLSQAASIAVAQNPALVDTNAFGQLFSVETFTVTENAHLTHMTVGALNDVVTFTVADNPLLVSVFARCLVSAHTVSLQNNAELTELIMPTLADAAFSVTSNPKLPQCKVDTVSGGSCNNCTGNDEVATCD